jgi:hypothetical protein
MSTVDCREVFPRANTTEPRDSFQLGFLVICCNAVCPYFQVCARDADAD